MLKKSYWIFAMMLVMVSALVGCGQGKAVVSSQASDLSPLTSHFSSLSPNASLRYQYFYLEAVRLQEAGKYDAAFDLFIHCLKINPQAAEVYYALASYYAELKQDSMTMACFKKAAELSPANSTYLERLARVYINENRIDDAIGAYERLYTTNKDRTDVLTMLLRLYEHKKDYRKMIETIDRMELTDGSSEQIALTRMSIYEQQGKKKEALNELKKLSERHPNDLNYRVMIGNWLLQDDQRTAALAEFQHVLKEEPDNTLAQMSLLDYYRANGQDSIARLMQEKMLVSEKTPSETKQTLMRQVVQESEQEGGDSVPVLRLFDRILAQKQQGSEMAELQAAYMTLKQMPKDSVNKALERVLDIAPDNAGARIQLLQNIWETKDYDRVISLAKAAQEYNPDEMAFYYFLGMGYFQQDRRDEALDAFRRGTSVINEQSNKDIASDFYGIMGDILHDKGLAAEAYAAYDSCLQYKSDNYGCLNNYAYYLSEEDRDLQKAEQMSYRTVKAEPDNSTYLDTYAWILFKQRRYAEAKLYIDQALQNDTTQSAVLLEHGGDIYAMNNELDKAVAYWQQAQESGGGSKVLIRKIKLRKYLKD